MAFFLCLEHLSRLHMILKPFMMRRIKRDVEEELGEKIEIMVNCPLTRRQQVLYEALKHKISIEDLLYSQTSTSSSHQSESTSSLMNLVMHFRKVPVFFCCICYSDNLYCFSFAFWKHDFFSSRFATILNSLNVATSAHRFGCPTRRWCCPNSSTGNVSPCHFSCHVWSINQSIDMLKIFRTFLVYCKCRRMRHISFGPIDQSNNPLTWSVLNFPILVQR